MKIDEKETQERQDKHSSRIRKQREVINKQLDRKDYILTVTEIGDEAMSSGEHKRKVFPNWFWTTCSLREIPDYIAKMQGSWWQHPDLKKGSKVKAKDIPFDEKKWGLYNSIVIQPLTEELEKSYVKASKEGYFKLHREMIEQGIG